MAAPSWPDDAGGSIGSEIEITAKADAAEALNAMPLALVDASSAKSERSISSALNQRLVLAARQRLEGGRGRTFFRV